MARKGEHTGSGIPAGGAGWGGPAKGKGTGGPKLGVENLMPGDHGQPRPTAEAVAAGKSRAERMRAILDEIASDPKAPPQARVAAADRLLDRIEGKPVQTNLNANVDDVSRLSDDDLHAELARQRAELARLRGESVEAGTGGGAASLPN